MTNGHFIKTEKGNGGGEEPLPMEGSWELHQKDIPQKQIAYPMPGEMGMG